MAKERTPNYFEEDGYEVHRTCAWSPPGCHPVGCGLKLYVKDGRLEKVEGDENHPITNGRLCIRCLALKDYVYHPERVVHPMKRAREDRGKDKWERITWDEAYDIVCDNVKRISEKYGPHSIVEAIGTGTAASISNTVQSASVLKTPNATYMQSGYSCYAPRMAVSNFVLGATYPEIDYAAQFEDRYEDDRFEDPEYIMIWGKSPIQSNPDGFFGHSIVDLMQRGAKLIIVDPRMNWLASRAEHWLQVRPGSDTALALGMINYIIEENLYDHDFVDRWCYGFDELKERVAGYDLDKVEQITWVPKEKIVAAVRAYATAKRASLQWGLATDQKPNGTQMGQALVSLMAITGNVDIPGGNTIGTIPLLAIAISGQEDAMDQEIAEKQIGRMEYPAFHAILGSAHADLLLDQMESGVNYPIKMLYIKNSNFLSCTATAPERWYRVFEDMEFCCATDCFITPTIAALADVFLPLATFAEYDSFVAVQFGNVGTMVSAINKAITVGEAKPEWDISFEMGKRLNPEAWPWQSVTEMFTEWILKPSLGITFEELQEKQWVYVPFEYRKYESGRLRPDGKPGFMTPTGRVELYSTQIAKYGDDPLPYYEEPPYSPEATPELMEEYPYILTTGARAYAYFHSEGRQIPVLRETNPDPIVEIHPDTAKKIGVNSGEWVVVENMLGKCRQKVKVTPGIDPRVVHCQHGWWFPEKSPEGPDYFGTFESNVNNLMPNGLNGKLGFGAPVKCMICNVYKEEA